MKKFLKVSFVFVMALSLFMVAGCGGQGGENEQDSTQTGTINLTVASGPAGGTWYPLGGAIGKIIQENIPGAVVSVQQGGGEANIKGVDQGMYDIGITFSHTAAEAMAGEGQFDAPVTNVAGLAALYPGAVQMTVRADSDIYQVEDLKGKRISPGPAGLSGETMCKNILQVHGLTYDDMAKVERVSYSDSASLLKDRQIDMYSPVTTWPAPSIQEIAISGGVRLIPLRQEKFEELKAINDGYSYINIPAGTYNGQTEDTWCLGSNNILVIRKDLPEELVYQITQVLVEHLDEIKSVHQHLSSLTKETMTEDLGLPMHPGAEKYYNENL